ncbi:hypothetical protein E4U32_003595 [Claviceps aff. humidiphila group G2b]|nr:hypothetical protein E4U32_003595 [Claviceps aff. humidiphila group G2b]
MGRRGRKGGKQETKEGELNANYSYSGVAIGSSIGHAIGGLFSGGSSEAPAQPAQAQAVQSQAPEQTNNCAGVTQQFTKCLDDNNGNMQICNWYLEQLKACQAAASPY